MNTQTHTRCFACDRRLGRNPAMADTRDDQIVLVGAECYRLIRASGAAGYQPPLGGPRLYALPKGLTQQQLNDLRVGKQRRVTDSNTQGGRI